MPTLSVIPQLGKHLTSVVITGQSVSAAGVFSDGSSPAAVTITTRMDGIDYELAADHEEISSLNSPRQNNVITSDGATCSIDTFKVANGDPEPLRTLVAAYDYFKLVWVEISGTAVYTCTYYGVRGTARGGFRGKGKQMAGLNFLPADIGGPNFTVVVT